MIVVVSSGTWRELLGTLLMLCIFTGTRQKDGRGGGSERGGWEGAMVLYVELGDRYRAGSPAPTRNMRNPETVQCQPSSAGNLNQPAGFVVHLERTRTDPIIAEVQRCEEGQEKCF